MMEKINPDDINIGEEDVLEEEWSALVTTVSDMSCAVQQIQLTLRVVLQLLRSLALALLLMLIGATVASVL